MAFFTSDHFIFLVAGGTGHSPVIFFSYRDQVYGHLPNYPHGDHVSRKPWKYYQSRRFCKRPLELIRRFAKVGQGLAESRPASKQACAFRSLVLLRLDLYAKWVAFGVGKRL
jgi:hypothetical protein